MTVTYSANSDGEGVSAGMARGLVLLHDANDITGEGLGIGAIAARVGKFTYFGEVADTQVQGSNITKHFRINRRLVWTIWGRPSPFLTKLGARSTAIYMSKPFLQKTLMHVSILSFVKRILGMGITFQEVPPVASARCDYALRPRGIDVTCRLMASSRAPILFYVMNELSADVFDAAVQAGRRLRLPSAWQAVDGVGDAPWFCCEARALRFAVRGAHTLPAVPVRSFWGREKARNVSWAGFEFELELSAMTSDVTLHYEVDVLEEAGRSR